MLLVLWIIILMTVLYIAIIGYYCIYHGEVRWNWDNISTSHISFPLKFIWGTATAAHQVEGNCTNNWSEFEQGVNDEGSPNITSAQQSGIACLCRSHRLRGRRI